MQITMDKTRIWFILGCTLSIMPGLGTEFKYKIDSFSLFYLTAPTPELAKEIARVLVEEKLAARVIIVPNFASIYDSKTREFYYQEAWMIVTARTRFRRKIEKVVGTKNPATSLDIVALPIKKGNPTYLEWMSTAFLGTVGKRRATTKNQIEETAAKPKEYTEGTRPAPVLVDEEVAPGAAAGEIEQQEQPNEYGEQNAEQNEPMAVAVNPEEEMMKQVRHHHHHHHHMHGMQPKIPQNDDEIDQMNQAAEYK